MMKNLTELIQNTLGEDLGDIGDITSLATVPKNSTGKAKIITKQEGIIAGGFVVDKVFSLVDPTVNIDIKIDDGTYVQTGQEVIAISGPLQSILTGERTALNFLCRLSGIATLTHQFVDLIKHTGVKLLDTRKTTPGLRWLEKYAVRTGGGFNHRIGLFDMVLIKENHITAAGGIENAITRCQKYMKEKNLNLKIEIETKNLNEVKLALKYNIDRIMLDNMSTAQVKEAVALVNKKVKLEISGGINLQNLLEYAQTGVDYISSGLLTHSAQAFDFSLLIVENN